MASKKKSEGIALLSMYMDVDDDEEEENDDEEENAEAEELPQQPHQESEEARYDDPASAASRNEGDDLHKASMASPESNPEKNSPFSEKPQTPPPLDSINGQTLKSPAPLTPSQRPQTPILSPAPPLGPISGASDSWRGKKGSLAIVDYAHDETAMSPEGEEGEIMTSGRVMFGEDLQTSGSSQEKMSQGTIQILMPTIQGQTASLQFSEQSQPSKYEINSAVNISEVKHQVVDAEVDVSMSIEMQEEVDPLKKFLPSPPTEKCRKELQEKINKFLALKKEGKSFNANLRTRKDYRNPDFLQHAVRYQDINQIGTCFSKDVFDPRGYDKSDYYDEIEADMKREGERKEQEKNRSQKVDFVTGGSQPGTIAQIPKLGTQISAVSASGLHSAITVAEVLSRDSRQNKKTKWDKVDGDVRLPLPPAGQDVVSAAAAHAAILSAANVGAGYTAFAQQKRKEAEEKRSSQRRTDRRS
ncbi:hypothetical protein QJS10_CPA03g00759 [Acorus calamus]|uniref:SAP30-binding protein n=1 Tax=Acorus calamus TaxID=4465 RepID=A0AAV9FAZ0_ACOCL|nr:hypothetical protein QJS10_CPA03g00759 [Acorus calamus]